MSDDGGTPSRGQPRSTADAKALALFDQRFALPLVLSAILPLVLAPGSTRSVLAAIVNIAAWGVFIVDFVVHERRLQHYLSTWLGRFDLSVVVLTAPWFLLFGPGDAKFVLVIRLARIARLVMATKGARRLFERLGRVALVAALVVVFSSAVAYGAEHSTNPGFKTYGDALWWGIVTLTTVGYGDIVPHTTTGRVAGIMIMFTGVAVLGLLAGSLASFFRIDPSTAATDQPETPGQDGAGDSPIEVLTREVSALRDQLTGLTHELSRLTSVSTDPEPERAPGPERAL
jgi:voltage-gated potassium channel